MKTNNDFEQFRQLVLGQVTLQEKLRQIEDHDDFIRTVVKLGNDNGYSFDAEDVRNAMNLSRRSWIERWV